MEALARDFFDLAYDDPSYRIVVFSTAALVLLVALFTVLALLLRMGNNRALRRRARLEPVWEGHLTTIFPIE